MTAGRVHIVGAGLAGLAAALDLHEAGHAVSLSEQAGHAGGRCRSYRDKTLERVIDNGNHLLLSANTAARDYLARCGASDSLAVASEARFPFVDLQTGERWSLRLGPGRMPWWILSPGRRVPGTRALDYLSLWRLLRAAPSERLGEVLKRDGALWRRFWEPLALAVLNTPAAGGSAWLLGRVLAETVLKGEAMSRPMVAREGLAASFVDPALAKLRAAGAEIAFNRRLKAVEHDGQAVRRLVFTDGAMDLDAREAVILALPPAAIADLLPEIAPPVDSHPIVNVHYRLTSEPRLPDDALLLGIVGGHAQWLFLRGDVASVTISAADAIGERGNEEILAAVWPEVAQALDIPAGERPPGRVIKEKRATFAQTPENLQKRHDAATRWRNLWLAGDWTATGFPATIEGAIRSGRAAADLVAQSLAKTAQERT